ncbi:MAG: prephenate dehydratase [Capsulimonas sp.]|uniref:prephenate dehydratase n=1 Tax=Capsulimonas sp. TaxID=2494211 RepID=UPI00326403C8
MSLNNLREQIDAIDNELVSLLNRRAEVSLQVGKQKASEPNVRIFAPERERDVIQRILALHNNGALPKEALVAIYREIISASIALQRPITVAYWGPAGTFTHIAALQRFGSSALFHDASNIPAIFGEVERGLADFGVVPVENSTEGVVNYTLDMFHETELKICAEIYVNIAHHLVSHAKSIADIKRLYTFSQPQGQCKRWLETHLPNVTLVETMPTSRAAERAAADPEGAGISTDKAAEIYGVPILQPHIEDNPNNRTRFLVVGRNEPPQTGRDKTSVLFAVKNAPGSLGRALRAFEDHNVNLSMIASRPTRNVSWEYVQFADFQGHEKDEPVQRALAELRTHSIYVNVLGSYPEG